MNRKLLIFGLILIFLGAFMWLNSMNVIMIDSEDFAAMFWPLVFIGIGIWLITRHRRRTKPVDPEEVFQSPSGMNPPPPPPPSPDGATGDQRQRNYFTASGQSDQWSSGQFSGWEHQSSRTSQQPAYTGMGKLKYDKFFGDMFIDCQGVDLQNMEVSVFVGDIEVKLHGATLAPGLNRMIISGFVGDVRILVPPDMAVFAQSSNFIGDSDLMGRRSSGFGSTLDAQTPSYGTAEKKLYIACNFFIGDIKVYVV